MTLPDPAGKDAPLPADAVDALIEAGACDEFGARLGLLQVARAAHRHPTVPVPLGDWGVLERAVRERARTGATLSGHPLRQLGSRLREWRVPGAIDGAGRDLGMRPTPIHRLPAAGNALTLGLVAEYAERGYSRGRMATLTLEGSRGRLRGVIWDQVLTELHHRSSVPTVGQVVAVRGRITNGTRPVATSDDGEDLDPAETVSTREVMISNVFPVDVADDAPVWAPPPGSSITELWAARSTRMRTAGQVQPPTESPARRTHRRRSRRCRTSAAPPRLRPTLRRFRSRRGGWSHPRHRCCRHGRRRITSPSAWTC